MNHSTTHAPLYLNNESCVCCLTYSGNNLSIFRREQVQPYLYRNEIGMRQHGQRSFTATIKNMESWVLTIHFFVAATIRPLVPDIYKRVCNVHGVWHSPIMAYPLWHTVKITLQQLLREDTPYHPLGMHWQLSVSSHGHRYQYPVFLK